MWLAAPPSLPPEPRIIGAKALPSGQIEFELENRGGGVMGADTQVELAVEGRIVEAIDTPSPGLYTTGTRMQGTQRLVGLIIVPSTTTPELTERNQAIAKRFAFDDTGHGDIEVFDLVDDHGYLSFGVRNVGKAPTPPSVHGAELRQEGELIASFGVEIPALGIKDEAWISSGVAIGHASYELLLDAGAPNADADTTNNWRRETLPYGPELSDFQAILLSETITESLIWRTRDNVDLGFWDWPWDMTERLYTFYVEIEEGRDPLRPRPDYDLEGCLYLHDDAINIYLAHVAHTLWLELSGRLDYSVFDYTPEQRARLFRSDAMVREAPYPGLEDSGCYVGARAGSIYSPFVSFGFLDGLGLLTSDAEQTTMNLADWFRSNATHLVGAGEPHYGQNRSDYELILYSYPDDISHSPGCSRTATVFDILLRTANIPVEPVSVRLGSGWHGGLRLPTLGQNLVHGDDLYGYWGSATYGNGELVPAHTRFVTDAEWTSTVEFPAIECSSSGCNTHGEQTLIDSKRIQYSALSAATASKVLAAYDAGQRFYEDWYLPAGTAQLPVFDDETRAIIEAHLEWTLVSYGDGDYLAGVEHVRALNRAIVNPYPSR